MASATWTDTNPDYTLSNGNKTATQNASSPGNVRASLELTTGKHYWEVLVGYIPADDVGIGVISPEYSDAHFIGEYNDGVAYACYAYILYDGSYDAWGATFVEGDIIGVAVDVDTHEIWFSKNGVWQESGDPSNGTNPANSGIPSTVVAATDGPDSGQVTTLVSAEADLTYPVPTDFTAGLDTGETVIEWPVTVEGTLSLSGTMEVVVGSNIIGGFILSGGMDVETKYSELSGAFVLSGGIDVASVKQGEMSGTLILSGAMTVEGPKFGELNGSFVLGGGMDAQSIIGNSLFGGFVLSGGIDIFNNSQDAEINGLFILGGRILAITDDVTCEIPSYNSTRWA